MNSPLGTVIIYARDMKKTAAFYSNHFGFKTAGEVIEGLIELQPTNGGSGILIHQAAKSVKLGQVGVKLSFHVLDVRAFVAAAAEKGLKFGAVHEANGYQFANAKDPDKNSVSISSRAFRSRHFSLNKSLHSQGDPAKPALGFKERQQAPSKPPV